MRRQKGNTPPGMLACSVTDPSQPDSCLTNPANPRTVAEHLKRARLHRGIRRGSEGLALPAQLPSSRRDIICFTQMLRRIDILIRRYAKVKSRKDLGAKRPPELALS
jgi:hypothetical protein